MFLLTAALAVVMLAVEWRARLRWTRTVAVIGALVLYTASHPAIHDAVFNVGAQMPTEPSVSRLSLGTTERRWFMTGALTLHRIVYDDVRETRPNRWLAVGMLVWLALTPAIRGRAPATAGAGEGCGPTAVGADGRR